MSRHASPIAPFAYTDSTIYQWGIFSAVAGLVAFQFSPLYRGLTFQFKV